MIQMGIFVKRRDGAEYLYVLAGNSQYFLGRKDNLDSLNMENLQKAANKIDGSFDRTMAKYLKDLQERAQYLPDGDRQKYLAKRLAKIDLMLKEEQKTIDEGSIES